METTCVLTAPSPKKHCESSAVNSAPRQLLLAGVPSSAWASAFDARCVFADKKRSMRASLQSDERSLETQPTPATQKQIPQMELMRQGDLEYFKKYYRMTPQQFDFLVGLFRADLQREHLCREPLCPVQRLAMTLRYLSSGDLVQDIALAFRVGIFTARESIRETCRALWTRLQPLYMKKPGTADWEKITESFQRNWQFPNCLGAVDGKHVRIRAPPNSGSMYHNYKDTFSIVLLAVADGDYNFVVVDVGAYGKQSDGGILRAVSVWTDAGRWNTAVTRTSTATWH
ncbi:uncharacterized protein LOC135391646 [Ornithodoros turicata]|uniref:uncharacterized protein LOC135391646 n=1 Tax=Ornithodoros turicata TaxID=34597 RepID=UPI0031398A76